MPAELACLWVCKSTCTVPLAWIAYGHQFASVQYVEQRHDHVAQKSVHVTYILVCILYKLSGPTYPDVLLQQNNLYFEQLCLTKLSTSFIVCNAQKRDGTGPSLQNLRNECAESKLLLFSEYQSGKAQEGCSLLCRLMTRQACILTAKQN